jgi:branched-chain amino acid transport system ATP-binding protein
VSVLLDVRGLGASLGGSPVLSDVDLVAREGRVTAVVGPNGAGKTTLLDCISGVVPPQRGVVRLRGDDVTGLPVDVLARRGLARTAQRSSVFPSLTVGENLLVGAENHRRNGIVRGLVGVADPRRGAAGDLVRGVAALTGLEPLLDVLVARVPAGTLRMVDLARALCVEPDVLLLDEPASGLDDAETDHLHHVLRQVVAHEIAVVLVEHDLALVQAVADDVVVIASGRVVGSGVAEDVLARRSVRAHLGVAR